MWQRGHPRLVEQTNLQRLARRGPAAEVRRSNARERYAHLLVERTEWLRYGDVHRELVDCRTASLEGRVVLPTAARESPAAVRV